MNSKRFYEKLETMQDLEILNYISATIEYLINVYDYDFDRVIKHLKKTHAFLEKVKRSED